MKKIDGHAKGTKMSISDLVAYLIGWGELVLKWNRKKKTETKLIFPKKVINGMNWENSPKNFMWTMKIWIIHHY